VDPQSRAFFLQTQAILPILSPEKGYRIWGMVAHQRIEGCPASAMGIQYSQAAANLFSL
jgi:hypothetical protein